MSNNPLFPSLPPDPVPGPDTPSPTLPPTPGPDTPPEPGLPPDLPPSSPGLPLMSTVPPLMTEGTAYPAPPPSYEDSPTTPPARTEGVNIAHSDTPEPTYQPTGIASSIHAEASHTAREAYPEAPHPYEQTPPADPASSSAHTAAPTTAPPAAVDSTLAAPGLPGTPPRGSSKAPTALVTTVILVALALVLGGAWYFLHAGGHVITAGGELAATAAGLHYENGHEGIAFTAPGTWSRFPAATAQIMVRGEGCSFGLLEQRTLLSAQQLADAEAKDLHRRHPEAAPVITPRYIAGHEGLAFTGTYTDSEGQPMTQTYILVDRGANLLTLIETGTSPTCPAAFLSLEDSLHI